MVDQLPDEQEWLVIQRALECYCICTEASAQQLEPAFADCAELCQAAAGFVLRGSPLRQLVLDACVEACERCARACDQAEETFLDACAEACRRCAEAIRAWDTDARQARARLFVS